MAKLVVLSEGMTGRTHELKVDKTTIGRVEDNTFQIAEAFRLQSSLRSSAARQGRGGPGSEFHQRHLHQRREGHREASLKPGQILRLGQIEMRLETETPRRSQRRSTLIRPWSCSAA